MAREKEILLHKCYTFQFSGLYYFLRLQRLKQIFWKIDRILLKSVALLFPIEKISSRLSAPASSLAPPLQTQGCGVLARLHHLGLVKHWAEQKPLSIFFIC